MSTPIVEVIATLKGPRGWKGERGPAGVNAVPTMDALAEYRRTVPAYVTAAGDAVDNEYNADLRLFNESSADMFAIRRDLGLTKASTGSISTQILCLGDSKTWGRGDGYPTWLRDMMGALDGMVFAQGAGHTYPDPRWSLMSGFTLTGIQLYLTAAANATSQVTLTLTRRANGVRVWWYSSGSMGTQQVTIDGGAPVALVQTGTRIPSGLANGWYYMDITGLTDASHTVKVSATTTGGSFWFLGVEPLHTGQAVTTVINAGVSSSTVADWVPGSTSQLNEFNAAPGLLNQGPERKIAIVQLGTNSSASEVANYRTTVIRLRELGYSVLNVAPGGTATSGSRGTMKRTQYLVAQELSMPLVDFTDLIGDDVTAAARGYMEDTLHENDRGERFEAAALLRILNAA